MEMLSQLVTPEEVRRFVRVALFVGLLVLFRPLLVLLVFFVLFERTFGAAGGWLAKHRVHRKGAIAILALAFVGAWVAALALGVGRALREAGERKDWLTDRIADLRETPLYQSAEAHMQGVGGLVEHAQHVTGEALHYAARAGHVLLYALIGFILAVVYLLEEDELREWAEGLDPASLIGTFHRWLGHVADAVSVTLQFQVIVAACNAVLTFPVLLALGIHHRLTLLFMIFFSGMVPVVGNFIAGAILTLLAYQAKGWVGVGAFTALTFVLHKLESYYLNPRLARRHVHLPGFVLIVSLLVWEHLLGFAGLFVSFPFLFVVFRIRDEFRDEDTARARAAIAHTTLTTDGGDRLLPPV